MVRGNASLQLGALAGLLLLTLSVRAQVAGRLGGSVVDQTGSAVPGATVNLYLRDGLQPVLSGKTTTEGLFSFSALRPETYDLGVEATGFAKLRVREAKVSPGQELGLPPIRLELKSASHTVEVTADVQGVQLSNAEVSSTITSTQVQNLPVFRRELNALFTTQPGVSMAANFASANGLRTTFSNVTLDGINVQDNYQRLNSLDFSPVYPTIDQVSEMSFLTSNAGSAFEGGAYQVVLSTKSGSNSFHGSFYWYNRNYKLASNDWFNNKSGVPRPGLNLNQTGAALSGRIIRDKLYFYSNVEIFRDKEHLSILRTVLTDPARNGVFTYRDTSGVLRTVNLTGLRTFTPDPTVKAMIGQLPAANSADTGDGLNTSGYRFNARANESKDQFIYKSDYYFSTQHSLSGTYDYAYDPVDRPDFGTFYSGVPPVSNSPRSHLLSLSWRWTPFPAVTNEARGGFSGYDVGFDNREGNPEVVVGGLLFSNPVNTWLEQGRTAYTYHLQDNAHWNKGKHELAFGFQGRLLRVSPFNDNGIVPSYTLGISGANSAGLTPLDLPGIRTGDLNRANSLYANLAGIISTASRTFNVTSMTSGFVPGATNRRNLAENTFAGYIQDKWRLRSGLTVNLGLRYEYWGPVDEKDSLYLVPRLENSDLKGTLLNPNAVLDFSGKSAGRPLYAADRNNVAPNVGIAWDPFGKGRTSIRVAYRIAFVNDNFIYALHANANANSGLQFARTLTNQVGYLSNPPALPAPVYKVPRTLADNYAMTTTGNIGAPDPHLSVPFVQEWNLGVEHEVKGSVFALRYLGNHAAQLLRAIDYNQVLYNASGFLADFQRAQSNAALAQAAGFNYNGSYNASIPGSVPLTVFPLLFDGGSLNSPTIQDYLKKGQVGTLADYYMTSRGNGPVSFYPNPNVRGAHALVNGAYSEYHAAQLEVRKRTRSGDQFQFSYTFGKALSDSSNDSGTNLEPLLDNNNPSLEQARSALDITHLLKANYYYELPYGHGKRWSGGRFMNRMLGGWALSGIWGYQSGTPFSVLCTLGTLNRAERSWSTNTASVGGVDKTALAKVTGGLFMTGDGPYFISPSVIGPDGRGTADFGAAPFAGQVFFNPAAGSVGNLQRRMFSGPWQLSWDASVVKSVQLAEGHRLDLHFDVFNWLNHPTFWVPSGSGQFASPANFNINNETFGRIEYMNYAPRRIQIGAYYRF